MTKKLLWLLFLLCGIVFCSFPLKKTYAYELKELFFNDSFASTSSANWNIYNNGGNVSFGPTGLILSSSNNKNFPFLSSKSNIFPTSGNYELDIKYLFPSTTNFGVGFGFGNYIPTYSQTNYSDPTLFTNWVYYYVWQGINDNHAIYGSNCIDQYICNSPTTNLLLTQFDNQLHDLRIRHVDNNFEINHNGTPIFNQILLNSVRRPTDFWIGNPIMLQTINNWTSINVVELSVYKLTEAVSEKEVVVVLPGFGGSWDLGAVLAGTSGSNWKIPAFVKEYDGVINSLKNAGYEENKDLFIFPYDWRKSINSLATDLKDFIDSKNLGNKKINLVGHSMGGLVARTYLQNFNNPNVNKVITAGSPHLGIVDAYGVWEGAVLGDGVWWQKVLLEIATEVNRLPRETKIEALRRIAPSIKDLMPTEDFLKQNLIVKPWNSLTFKNDFLKTKNLDLALFLPKIIAGGSEDFQTRANINVEAATLEDKMQGLWVDGKPKANSPFEFLAGDGYVTKKSSIELFTDNLKFTGGHGDAISKLENINKILGELNIATEGAVASGTDTREGAFVAKLSSPGKLHICFNTKCDSDLGIVFENEKLMIVPGYNHEKYSITVESQGELGDYKLLIGEINNIGNWKNTEGRLTKIDQKDNYFYDGSTDQLSGDAKTIESSLKLYWPKKPKLSQVYDLRKSILEEVDKNIKENRVIDFDKNINKWRALDYFVASEYSKDKFFNHDGWDLGLKKIKPSRYFTKTNNYFSATLTSLQQEKEREYKAVSHKQLKLKIDKFIQVLMLKSFMRM